MILAAQYKPLNLGQGFPDFAAPKYVTDALGQVAQSDNLLLHQYTRGFVRFHLIFYLIYGKKNKGLIGNLRVGCWYS